MTKTKLGQDVKPTEGSPAPIYTAVHVTDYGRAESQAPLPGTTCWYVFGVLSTIFCCLPCGVIGLVHAMIAKHEGERGNISAHRRRMYQAKCWTSWSIVLGLITLISTILFTIGATIGFSRAYDFVCGTPDFYYDGQWNSTMWNESYYGELMVN